MKHPADIFMNTHSDLAQRYNLASEAIRHVLNALADDPRKFWLMGDMTGSYEKLTAAYASMTGKSIEQIKESFRPERTEWDRYVQEKESNDKLLEAAKEGRDITVHTESPPAIDFDSWWLNTGQFLEPVAGISDHNVIEQFRQFAKRALYEAGLEIE